MPCPLSSHVWGGRGQVTEEQLREMLAAFGCLRAFRMTHAKAAPGATACAFIEYRSGEATAAALVGLNGLRVWDTPLLAMLATPDAAKPSSSSRSDKRPASYAVPTRALPLLVQPERVLQVKSIVTPEQLEKVNPLPRHGFAPVRQELAVSACEKQC